MTDITIYDHPGGARDSKGHFEPFYVPRPIMPQVHQHDYPELIGFLFECGVETSWASIDPMKLSFHQRVSEGRVHQVDESKPLIVSLDRYVLDGNHREEAHREDGTPCQCLVVHLPFGDAIEALLAFPKTETYAVIDAVNDNEEKMK
jgi:hypothetical protein